MRYPIVDVFKSFQGEGHFMGYPMVFVRLAGCSVGACHIRAECDEAPWRARRHASENEIADEVISLMSSGIVCLTGGEPTDHDLIPIVAALKARSLRIHLETSGTRSVAGYPFDWITVSPKTPEYVQRIGHTLKLVVRPGWRWADVLSYDVGTCFFHRYLQPLTQPDGSTNLNHVLGLLRETENSDSAWGLSTQAHKLWGIP